MKRPVDRSRTGAAARVAAPILPLLSLAVALVLAVAGPALAQDDAAASDPEAKALLDAIDDLYRSDESRAVMRMEVMTPNWSRTLEIEAWSKGRDLSLFKILAPKKERGTTTLRRGNEIWNYLPKVRRVMKLPSSMMSASWMGSDFSNDDLVKESRMARDYTFAWGDTTELDGRPVREVICVPRPDAPVVWGRLSVLTEGEGAPIPVRITYYDEDLREARTMSFADVADRGGRRVPTRVVLQPTNKPDQRTIIVYEELDFDADIDESLFTIQSLKR